MSADAMPENGTLDRAPAPSVHSSVPEPGGPAFTDAACAE